MTTLDGLPLHHESDVYNWIVLKRMNACVTKWKGSLKQHMPQCTDISGPPDVTGRDVF